ncbi:MAG: hypothetical protein R2758_15900 [Bacteroidales bacterium]
MPDHLVSVMGQLEEACTRGRGDETSTDREYLRAAMNSTTRLANLIRSYNPVAKPETGLRLLDRVFRRIDSSVFRVNHFAVSE